MQPKRKEVEEIRPTEETYKIDPEHEHQKKKNDQELSEQDETSDENLDENGSEDLEIDESQEVHKLDIVV
ncbi:hypothetical protein [Campylobacter fetus]|uniref:hypothetical protein n=1 Tax=Campylobacter fetus TaxID=196 RepID=UPI002931F1B4|nr:hypothetical protein [Campylobacter fetus]WNY80197.1 hypothetical protein NL677_01055 [Campylobacter fetus subsp. fetus]